ncbi:MAG: ATP-binding protein [Candidatus Woesearchaeota archaeon]
MSNIIKETIIEFHQREFFDLISRNIIVPNISELNKVLVITGPRRAGKTFLMYEIMLKKINEKHQKEEFVYLNFDDIRFSNMKTIDFARLPQIYAEIYEHKPIFFLDEIQNLNDWESLILSLLNRNFEVYVTGSNAKLLSKEISTKLRGKSLEIQLFPFSFYEFLNAKKITLEKNWKYSKQLSILKRNFKNYFEIGGFPEIVLNPELSKELLKSYIDQVIYKDISERYDIRNNKLIQIFINYLINNMSSKFTIRSFQRYVQSLGIKSSTSTIHSFVKIIEDSYFTFFVDLYDVSYKKRQANPKKTYLIDVSYNNLSLKKEEHGRLLENIVFIELKRRNYDIFYHQDKYECDFIIQNKTKIISAIQVCYELNEKNKDREINGLLEAMNKFNLKEGIILTLEQSEELKFENKKIKIISIVNWLLENQ